MLNNDKAILLIRGEKPVIDDKYDILKHPNVKCTTDGDGKIYEHGEVTRATGTIETLKDDELKALENATFTIEIDNDKFTYELLSEEDIEEYINEMEQVE